MTDPETKGATAAIAEFASTYALDAASARERTTHLLADALACAIASSATPVAGLMTSMIGHGARSTIVGRSDPFHAADAAWLNGTLIHLDQWDDTTLRPVGHPGCTVIPAALALAEEVGASGEDLLAACLIGFEVHGRLGAAQESWNSSSPWLPLGDIGLIAAATAAGRVLGLDPLSMVECLNLASVSAGLSGRATGTIAKPLGAGSAARAGVVAARLAEAGYRGPVDSIEVANGFGEVFQSLEAGAHQPAVSALGGPLFVNEIGVATKLYPVSWAAQAPTELVIDIVDQYELSWRDIRETIVLYPAHFSLADDPSPLTAEKARFSFQYCAAIATVFGAPLPRHFAPGLIRDPRVVDALSRVRARPNTGADPRSFVVHIATDSTRYSASCTVPAGHPRRPASRTALRDKIDRCLDDSFAAGRTDAFLETIESIQLANDLVELTALLKP